MKDDRKTYAVEFSSANFDATATIEIKALSVEQAIEKAEACLRTADFAPQLMNFWEVS